MCKSRHKMRNAKIGWQSDLQGKMNLNLGYCSYILLHYTKLHYIYFTALSTTLLTAWYTKLHFTDNTQFTTLRHIPLHWLHWLNYNKLTTLYQLNYTSVAIRYTCLTTIQFLLCSTFYLLHYTRSTCYTTFYEIQPPCIHCYRVINPKLSKCVHWSVDTVQCTMCS